MKPYQLFLLINGICFATAFDLAAQSDQIPEPSTATKRQEAYQQRQLLQEKTLLEGIPFRNIGPSVQSGRVVDMAVWEKDPSHFYVAYASGGLWKTANNGTTFQPLFDQEAVMTIGDIAVDWERNTIWLGTGEVNSSRSSYAGMGIYKSTDGGKNWQYLGLPESHHIGRIILHPSDPNTAWVAVLGHLYSPNAERGVYKTTDGGLNWEKTLYVNENTGAVDLLIHPDNPNELYAATWHRERRAWNFVESGTGSGIYKSTDGGQSWQLISDDKSGFPVGAGCGRIGLDLVISNDQSQLFAAVDNYNLRPKEAEAADKLSKDQLRTMSKADFLALKDYLIKDYLAENDFPEKYTVEAVRALMESDEISPATLVEYTEDANAQLLDAPVIGLEVYRLNDKGKWEKTHDDYLDNVYNSYGYYFGQIRVASYDPQKVYLMGVPIIRSDDGGKTFKGINGENVHGDHHDLWINPNRPGHLILGNDGGINISYDDGESWIKCNTPPVGQFYAIAVDMEKPYRVYGGLQDNGVWMGPSDYEASVAWHDSGQYPYRSIMGGDGMQVAVDTRDNETVFTGYQFGNYYRIHTPSGESEYITPKPDLGERPYRWNWQSPIHLSIHNQDVLYMGANKLLRSLNQGDSFEEISGDLTQGGKKGDVPYGTLTSIHESPMRFGLLYAGSDDGLLHVSQNGGYSWEKISDQLPQNLWVSRVQASAFEEGRVYASLNGYRWDDFSPYLYVSEDFGKNWTAIGQDLPAEPINVVREDPSNENILYVGTDHGLYVSLDRGQHFMAMNGALPAVSVHDLVVHPRDRELVLGTHGRSLFVARVKELQQLDEALLAKELHAFEPDKLRYSSRWGNNTSWWTREAPKALIPIFCRQAGKVEMRLSTSEGLELQQLELDVVAGINYLPYPLTIQEKPLKAYNQWLNKDRKADEKPIEVKTAKNGQTYVYKGKYKVVLKKDGAEATTEFVVE
ncbi:MAG TPA: glycosyl hydrolase [Saprospiraceae bacterium]|nr:glycosyl hydrolase [Saprospiraceae bacterium]HMQ81747.1 glycosyl hydrolase [Saprospiraceae bacterium]